MPGRMARGTMRWPPQGKEELVAASKVLHIPLLDHLVIGFPDSGKDFISLRKAGFVKFVR